MTLQLFVWVGHGEVQENRIHYHSFTLNDQTYHVGDCVYLYPEDEQYPPYIARILAAFVDRDVQSGADPHCIEVKWFERRVNLEPSTKGIEESEREVFELEDTDINPIGCISGKCQIVKAPNYEEAYNRCGTAPGWFFCRGYFHQSSNSFVAYAPAEMAAGDGHDADGAFHQWPHGADGLAAHGAGPRGVGPQPPLGRGPGPAGSHPQSGSDGSARGSLHAHAVPHEALPPSAFANGGAGGPGGGAAGGSSPYDVDEESDEPAPAPRRQAQQHHPPAQQQPASKRQKATGRTCVECGATTTPQWREGPMGPKTLCNACGVRYVRSQQKAAGQKRSGAGQKNGQGRPQELTSPRAQQQTDRVTKRGSSQKAT